MSGFLTFLRDVNDAIWVIPFTLLVCLGIYATLRLKGIQFRELPEIIGTLFSKKKGKENSSLRVFLVSLGTTVGVGVITGPVLAIMAGGPGAIFWLWVFAFMSMAVSFMETTISQVYKVSNGKGGFRGGAAYNILHGLANPKLAVFVAVIMMLMHFVGFSSMEACSISESLSGVFKFDGNVLIFSLIISALLIVVMVGGFKRVSGISHWVVPFMAVLWLIFCCVSIALSRGGIFNAFGLIAQYAFNIPAVIGGGLGTIIVTGMKRGILSYEAGLGTSTYITAKADVGHPAKQGFAQALTVLLDTVFCTLTALVVLSYGNFDEIYALSDGRTSQEVLQYVFQSSLGDIAPYVVMVFVFLFAFTSMMGTFLIGSENVKFLTKDNKVFIASCAVMVVMVFVSAFFASDELFAIVDILLAVTATVNCITTFILRRIPFEVYSDFKEQKKRGVEEPVFSKSCMSDQSGITSWGDDQ